MEDKPLFSFSRILRGIRQWFYFAVVCEEDMPVGVWTFIRYHERPWASHRDGVY